MATITRIRLWYYPGFSENAEEVPHQGYTLPTANVDMTTVSLTPPIGDLFSVFRTTDLDWTVWNTMTYMEVTVTWSGGGTSVFYGWIDGATVLADNGITSRLTEVRWHVDLWFTYLTRARFNSGHVLRRPVSGSEPIQGYNPRFWTTDSETSLLDVSMVGTKDVWWALISTGHDDGSGNTWIRYYCWPISKQGVGIYAKPPGGTAQYFPTLKDTFMGRWDECLGVDPSAIYGAWLVPFAPGPEGNWTGTGTSASPVEEIYTGGWRLESHGTRSFWVSDNASSTANYFELFTLKFKTAQPSFTPSELRPVHITGFDGTSVLRLPIGKTVSDYDYRLSVSATECYIEIRWNGDRSRMEGTCAVIPALPLETTENAWSSYQYSGQRDYEVQSREEASLRGTANIVSGGSTGALAGGFTPIGAAAGAVLGALGQGIQSGVDFLWYNEATQNTADRYSKSQSAGILIPGGAWDCFYNGKVPRKAVLAPDSYSDGVYSAERSRVGVRVDEYNSSNTSVKSSTGYYQIANLVVTGDIPNAAKAYMSRRLAEGVRLI